MQVLINVIGTQQLGGESDKIELTTVGTVEEDEGSYIVRYKEEQEPPLSAIDVKVVIGKKEQKVEMTRSGAFDSHLIIESSKRHLCHYGSEYGDILMGISGHSISADFDGEKGTFEFRYDIDVNGALASKNKLFMRIKKNQE